MGLGSLIFLIGMLGALLVGVGVIRSGWIVNPLTGARTALAVRLAVVAARIAALPMLALAALALDVALTAMGGGELAIAVALAVPPVMSPVPVRGIDDRDIRVHWLVAEAEKVYAHAIHARAFSRHITCYWRRWWGRGGNGAAAGIARWRLALILGAYEAGAAVLIPFAGVTLDATLLLLRSYLAATSGNDAHLPECDEKRCGDD